MVSDDALRAALDAIGADLARLTGALHPTRSSRSAARVTNLAAVKHALSTYDPDVVQGTVLDRDEIDRQIELYRTATARQSGAGSSGCRPPAPR